MHKNQQNVFELFVLLCGIKSFEVKLVKMNGTEGALLTQLDLLDYVTRASFHFGK